MRHPPAARLAPSGTSLIHPAKAGNNTGEVKKGEKVIVARATTVIVDEAGDRHLILRRAGAPAAS